MCYELHYVHIGASQIAPIHNMLSLSHLDTIFTAVYWPNCALTHVGTCVRQIRQRLSAVRLAMVYTIILLLLLVSVYSNAGKATTVTL